MKTKIVIAVMVLAWFGAIAGGFGKGSHPDSKSNGIGSPRFPNHYSSPSHPVHP